MKTYPEAVAIVKQEYPNAVITTATEEDNTYRAAVTINTNYPGLNGRCHQFSRADNIGDAILEAFYKVNEQVSA